MNACPCQSRFKIGKLDSAGLGGFSRDVVLLFIANEQSISGIRGVALSSILKIQINSIEIRTTSLPDLMNSFLKVPLQGDLGGF